MSETLASFNDLPADEAERRLLACCGSRAWASAVAAQRPYADLSTLMETSDSVWAELTPSGWSEAFAAHPRLGERGGRAPDSSEKEQGRLMGAEDETLAALAEENRRYEARFGHVFLMSAAGHSATDVLTVVSILYLGIVVPTAVRLYRKAA